MLKVNPKTLKDWAPQILSRIENNICANDRNGFVDIITGKDVDACRVSKRSENPIHIHLFDRYSKRMSLEALIIYIFWVNYNIVKPPLEYRF